MEAKQQAACELGTKHSPSLVIWLLVIGLGMLGYLSVYQYDQIQQLQQQHQQEIRERANTTQALVCELTTLNHDLAGQLDELRKIIGHDKEANQQLQYRLASLNEQVSESSQRVDNMIKQYNSTEDVLAAQSGGVCLIEGEYEFYDPATGKPLRFDQVSSETANLPSALADAKESTLPVSTEGRGSPLAVHYTGTGFLVDSRGYILTNHHVVEPWRASEAYQRIVEAGYEARTTMLRVFFPNQPTAFSVKVVAKAKSEDAALIWADLGRVTIPVLSCDDQAGSLKTGQRVIVLGYPTGFEVMLARLGKEQLSRVIGDGLNSYDQVARNLASQGLIQPTATSGLCSRVGGGRIVYDAQTAIGGSGAPVLNSNGKVVAINTAILKSFSGSNFGVPIGYGLELLKQYAGEPQRSPASAKNMNEKGRIGR